MKLGREFLPLAIKVDHDGIAIGCRNGQRRKVHYDNPPRWEARDRRWPKIDWQIRGGSHEPRIPVQNADTKAMWHTNITHRRGKSADELPKQDRVICIGPNQVELAEDVELSLGGVVGRIGE